MWSLPVQILALGSLAVLTLAVLACGGDKEPAPPTPAQAPAAAPTDATQSNLTAIPTHLPPFVIGVMESVTGPGETYGTVAVQAKQMAADEINAAGGVNGRRLELVVEDSQCSAKDAIAAYNKLTDVDGVKIILGTSCSGAMLGVAPLAEADGVILFSGLASNLDIATAGDYIFRTQISDVQVGIDTGNVLWADGVRKLATITETTDYAEGVRRTSVEQFEKRGGTVVAAERYGSDVADFRSQLTKLLHADPDALHSEFAAGTIIKQARELGYEGPIYAETISVGTTALEVAGEAATGMKAITADLDPDNKKGRRSWPTSESATTTSRYHGTWGQRTTTCTSRPSASGRPTTTTTPTASATACTASPGAARSETTTASTPTARSWVSQGWSWRSCLWPSGPRRGSTGCSGWRQGRRTLRPRRDLRQGRPTNVHGRQNHFRDVAGSSVKPTKALCSTTIKERLVGMGGSRCHSGRLASSAHGQTSQSPASFPPNTSPSNWRAAGWRDSLHVAGGEGADRAVLADLQLRQASQFPEL